MTTTQHNLNINDYSMREILELYELSDNPSQADLQDAKKRMLMMHPDKSQMDPEYFRFYRGCYDRIVEYHAMLNKQTQDVKKLGAVAFKPFQHENAEQMREAIGKTGGGGAGADGDRFNALFEKHGVDREKQERSRNRWEWFSRDEPAAAAPVAKINKADEIGAQMEQMRSKTASVVVFKEMSPLVLSAGGSNFNEDEEDETAAAGHYVSSDPFSKLRFDDIRRVHKDQTILPVGEKEFAKRQQFASVKDYERARNVVGGPMDKSAAEKLLREQEAVQIKAWEARWENTRRRVDQNEGRNRDFMSAYLQLE